MITLDELHKCLDRLEEEETTLLSWGDTGGFFTRDEVINTLESVFPQHDPDELFLEMERRAMLLSVPSINGQDIYRTRMGESVHLYRNLRQWFHKKPITEAHTLVSDYRFLRRQRSYPERKFDSTKTLQSWNSILELKDFESLAVKSLLEPIDKYRLAGFQVRSTERIIKAYRFHSKNVNGKPTGTIVCAGTGSGKTLAFYLPAITALVESLRTDHTPRVRILAIYPRKELLKDQFMESWGQCRKLDQQLKDVIGRKIRIGAYFGDTPLNQVETLRSVNAKASLNNGMSFDLLRCSTDGCKGSMRWSRVNIENAKEELTCSICSHKVGHDEIGLTRDSLSKNPPDILFTTTEMLNQNLGNHYHNHLFGIGQNAGPVLVLLDEVHTYGGNLGAQTSYLLRRWMQRSFCRPHFVGLSATLADAENFFAELVGADSQHIQLIEPKVDEMIDEGAEYLLALRGDPVSQKALLSTTIQASMLTRRLLDDGNKVSKGTWGSKTFIFTDDLDVNNRLFHQLADAEGWKTSYKGLVPESVPLANLRGPSIQGQVNNRQRILLGQDWGATRYIGHTLGPEDRARIARTSSQDSGVDPSAEVVVATSTLEVGFNDPSVGAVIQHKAPRDVASYLQRKGRAGRLRSMRPWMIVILSEFGRDRVAFQRYESLMSPEIKRQGLPLRNGHIQKMQAAMTTLDWLGMKLVHGSIWTILNKPNSYKSACKKILQLVDTILEGGELQDAFVLYLGYALQIDDVELQRILWSPPRSIMMEFLPTLRRLLESNWNENGIEWKALRSSRSPMPDFIPDALFSELNLPRLHIGLQRWKNKEYIWDSLSFYQGLREFSPGRISKRYAVDSNYEADWLVPKSFIPTPGRNQDIYFDIQEAFGNNLGDEGLVELEVASKIQVYRPHEVFTSSLDSKFKLTEKSNSQLYWNVQFTPPDLVHLHMPPSGSWNTFLRDITFCTHQTMTPLEVIRFSSGARANLNFRTGDPQISVDFKWQLNGVSVGIGTRQWVDGMRLRFNISHEDILNICKEDEVLRGLRPVFFRHLVVNLDYFQDDHFTAGWVSECYLAFLASEMIFQEGNSPSIERCIKTVSTKEGMLKLQQIPGSLFQSNELDEGGLEQELQAKLKEVLTSEDLLKDMEVCSEALWKELHHLKGFEAWVKIVLGNTLAAASLQTLCTLFEDVDERSVIVDPIWKGSELSVWLSESESGGSGVVTRLNDTYFDDPIRFLNVFVRNLQPGDYEQIDYDLFAMLSSLNEDESLAGAFLKVREASDHKERRSSIKQLHASFQTAGFALSHSFLSVLHSRVLRQGSNKDSDIELLSILLTWRDLEKNTGIEWPLNIAAHTIARKKNATISDAKSTFLDFCKIQGLLWPRGYIIRQSELSYYNPFINEVSISERL
ncbi:protein DpdJ, partial [Flavobacterium sp.]|uniref:protein DpdJ n=1 Tax=Flavobacterium sp. TaxID=239 RepID=UPI00261BE4F5